MKIEIIRKLTGEVIKSVRERKGISQEKLANLLELKINDITLVENGEYNLKNQKSLKIFESIVDFLDIDRLEILNKVINYKVVH